MNLEGSCCGLIEVLSQHLSAGTKKKTLKVLVGIAGVSNLQTSKLHSAHSYFGMSNNLYV
jgi:hypothetical protein